MRRRSWPSLLSGGGSGGILWYFWYMKPVYLCGLCGQRKGSGPRHFGYFEGKRRARVKTSRAREE